MKKVGLGVVLIMTSVLLAGCASSGPTAATSSNTGASTNAAAATKVGTTTKTGMVKKVGKTFILQVGNQSIGVDSYNVDLSQYAGQTVTVSGEYSGDTLFVSKVE